MSRLFPQALTLGKKLTLGEREKREREILLEKLSANIKGVCRRAPAASANYRTRLEKL